MTTLRWVLSDPLAGETWTMPINPNEMSSPVQDRQIATVYGVKQGPHRIRSFLSPTPAMEWSFGGVIRSEEHYLTLVAWAKKERKVRITDHLGRTFEVVMESFSAEDRKPTPRTPWRLKYTMKTLLLRQITATDLGITVVVDPDPVADPPPPPPPPPPPDPILELGGTINRTGSGLLFIGETIVVDSADLSGSGTLRGNKLPVLVGTLTRTGSGTLTAGHPVSATGSMARTGSGSLAASGYVATDTMIYLPQQLPFELGSTTSTPTAVLTPLPPQPAAIVYDVSGTLTAYQHPGALVIAGRTNYADSGFLNVASAGGHVLIYLDMMVKNTTGRYHDKLFNSSEFGAAVPDWPGSPTANGTGHLADFRVGSVLLSKLEAVLELIVTENPTMTGFFADDLGSRSWFPGFDWDTWGSTNQNAYRLGAIAAAQTFRTVADRHGLIVMVNGTWTAGTTAAAGGGYPTPTTHGCSLAEGGVVEHHDGQITFWGPYAAASSQWGIPAGKPFCLAIMATSGGLTEFETDGRYAWITLQTDYGTTPTPWGSFHATGL